MFQMDEAFFAELQKECCWFTLPIFERLPDINPHTDILDELTRADDVLIQRHIFAMIFGGFGMPVNLSKAKVVATVRLGQLERCEPKNKSVDNPEFLEWLGLFAQYNILLGTVFAYLHMYPLAATLLINGLKTRAINLSMPYCDFIRYVLEKVAETPAELAEYDGCGFSVDEPMGSTERSGGTLLARAAELIILALEGNNREIVLSYCGNQKYGGLRRLGAKTSGNFQNPIDIYEVLIADRHFNIKKIRFFFNGYFSAQGKCSIRLPNGFRLDPLSEAAQVFEVID